MTETTGTASGGGLPVAGGSQTWRVVWRMSHGHRRKLVAAAVLGIVAATAGLVAPAAIGYLVDGVQDGTADVGTVVWVLAVMIAAAVAGAAGAAVTVVLAARSYHAILAELRERLVERAMSLPQSVVEDAGTGDLVSRSSDDVAQVADAAPQIIPAFTTVVFTILVTFAGMAALDLWYGLALIVVLPVYVVTVRWYLRTGPRVYRAERAAMSGRAQQLVESQRGHATILGFDLTEHRHHRVLDASWNVVAHSLRARTVQNMFFGRLNIAEYLGMAAILLAGFWLIDAGQSTVGAATAAMLLFLRLFGPIGQLLIVVDILQSVLASLARMVGVITTPTHTDTAPARSAPSQDSPATVQIEGVTHRYHQDSSPALHDITLTIDPGERIAIVGASGAGKSTLAAVIAGIHHAQQGTVARPGRTAVITQEVHTFAGTLRDNLTLAAPDAEDQDVRAALAATGASGLLELLPEGLDTMLGTTGHPLTAAQAQQIALARMVLADPDLAILDEATAEAGSSHANILDRAADAALAGRTGLVIAHRLSQAAACDRILVMAGGKIIEDGTHADLLASGGVYARLWEVWAQGRERADGPQ
ncbi:ATP-binding cassette, subfamily C [Brevibacterium aurantiacum]|uniref:ATP-binding cassette, subfamily C n=1 Tax=Brevibacterium aurantiacum TaxID=273384 RepID=A0A2H1KZ48_BREAU|nr:ABC transporter ATP-binding protein [Brevibacterium aurantiacum]SMY05043.1 ATP-binding cassette, subfamily C [Brevibacterium aurantiacum]